MASTGKFATIAALVGDPARAGMLHALMDGRALTASELARAAGIAPQTASGHLGRLAEAGLLTVWKQGRHRYHSIASPSVARMMESIMLVAADLEAARPPVFVGPREESLRAGRTCYDHLAGRLGVGLADALAAGGHLVLSVDGGEVTEAGFALFERVGIDVAPLLASRDQRSARVLCRPCLDWSERRPHLAGAIGAALCDHSLREGWIRRVKESRAVTVTPKGQRILREAFGLRAA